MYQKGNITNFETCVKSSRIMIWKKKNNLKELNPHLLYDNSENPEIAVTSTLPRSKNVNAKRYS